MWRWHSHVEKLTQFMRWGDPSFALRAVLRNAVFPKKR